MYTGKKIEAYSHTCNCEGFQFNSLATCLTSCKFYNFRQYTYIGTYYMCTAARDKHNGKNRLSFWPDETLLYTVPTTQS